jgi:hypothetical protein
VNDLVSTESKKLVNPKNQGIQRLSPIFHADRVNSGSIVVIGAGAPPLVRLLATIGAEEQIDEWRVILHRKALEFAPTRVCRNRVRGCYAVPRADA